MAAWLPLPSGFTGYATRFVDPALGFCLGWNYWFKVRGNTFIYVQLHYFRESNVWDEGNNRSSSQLMLYFQQPVANVFPVHYCYTKQFDCCIARAPVLGFA